MPYSATVYKVMIASPRDVVPERNVIREVLSEWNVVNSDTHKIGSVRISQSFKWLICAGFL